MTRRFEYPGGFRCGAIYFEVSQGDSHGWLVFRDGHRERLDRDLEWAEAAVRSGLWVEIPKEIR